MLKEGIFSSGFSLESCGKFTHCAFSEVSELIQISLYNIFEMKYPKKDVLAASAVFLFLLGIYYFTFSGFPVSDDEQLFAAVSQSLAAGEGTQAPQLYGNYRLLGNFTGSGPLHVYIGAALLHLLPDDLRPDAGSLFAYADLYCINRLTDRFDCSPARLINHDRGSNRNYLRFVNHRLAVQSNQFPGTAGDDAADNLLAWITARHAR